MTNKKLKERLEKEIKYRRMLFDESGNEYHRGYYEAVEYVIAVIEGRE